MKQLGVNAYRMSISWCRIYPKGFGKVNEKGIEFYHGLFNELLKVGIEPVVTLFHWDLPQNLEDSGGWANGKTVDYFVDYAITVIEHFKYKVNKWITINEPVSVSHQGYCEGAFPPCKKDLRQCVIAAHNLILAHCRTVTEFKKRNIKGQIGIALNLAPINALSKRLGIDDKGQDLKAAKLADAYCNRFFLDAVLTGRYPGYYIDWLFDEKFIESRENLTEDLKYHFDPMDFLGVNYYFPFTVRYDYLGNSILPFIIENIEGEYTEMGVLVDPAGLYNVLLRIENDYSPIPIYIMENGAAFLDKVDSGKVHDIKRIEYLKEHFTQAEKALADGIDLRGYFIWSFMDNFEWTEGYSKRFGLIYVDFGTQERIPKDSFYFMKKYIKSKLEK